MSAEVSLAAIVMILCAGIIILLVRYGLLAGIDQVANSLRWTAKTRGQVTGLATSAPEFVCLVAAGLAGVWEAGLWNIASSNIINAGLMTLAVLYFRQSHEIFNRRFVDEVLFAALAVVVPIVLMQVGSDQHWSLVPLLFGFFFVYRVVDRMMNRAEPGGSAEEPASGNLPFGLILASTALVLIAVTGFFLGGAAERVVNELQVHAAVAGWILGLMTSLPEMISFFGVYAASKKAGELKGLADTQEALDNLTSSNMANVGLVYPSGLAAYLLATAFSA